jgi:two-component system, LytTR family, sensor kinase
LEITDLFSGGVRRVWTNPIMVLINISVWALLFAIITILLSGLFRTESALLFASFNVASLMLLYYTNIYLIDRFIETKQYLIYTFCLVLLFVLIVVVRVQFNLYLIHQIVSTTIPVSDNWIVLFSTVITFIVLVISFFNGLLMNRSQKEKEYLAIIAHQRETQVEFLKTQMSPHFLFNTLNNIYSLSISKAPQASEMILLLSDVLRYAVYKSKENKVDLATEVKQIKKLLQLHALRSESRPAVSFTVEVSSVPAFIEPMILIPLVENCFKHSNIETSLEGYIALRLLETNGTITFETSNSKDKLTTPKTNSEGIGLKNIKERLSIRYANRHSFEITERVDSFSVHLQIKKGHD